MCNYYINKIRRRDVFIAIFSIVFGLLLTELYSYGKEYFMSPDIKVGVSFWGKKSKTEHTPDSTKILTYIKDDFKNCIVHLARQKAPRKTISSNLRPAHYVGFVISNEGNTRANNIELLFNLKFPGDSFYQESTYSTRASVSNTTAPLTNQRYQMVRIDHIEPQSYEVVVVGRIDSTTYGNYEKESESEFSFYHVSYDEIKEPKREINWLSFYQVKRAIEHKSYSSDSRRINVPFEVNNPDPPTPFSMKMGVLNSCEKSLPSTPWFKIDGSIF